MTEVGSGNGAVGKRHSAECINDKVSGVGFRVSEKGRQRAKWKKFRRWEDKKIRVGILEVGRAGHSEKKKTERSDTLILSILGNLVHFRHLSA
jgi:hypothetical protein